MRRILIVSLFLIATSAYADHIWRLWCGNPPKATRGSYTSAECRETISRMATEFATRCVDTEHGMVWKDKGTRMNGVFATCRENADEWHHCFCQAEGDEP